MILTTNYWSTLYTSTLCILVDRHYLEFEIGLIGYGVFSVYYSLLSSSYINRYINIYIDIYIYIYI